MKSIQPEISSFFLQYNAKRLDIYHCGETEVLFQADKKTHLLRVTEGVSLPRLTEVSPDQAMGSQWRCEVPAFHWVRVLWGLRAQNVGHLCQRTPACHQAGHTYVYTQHTAPGPLKKEGGEDKYTRRNNLSKHAHTQAGSVGQGVLTSPLPYSRTRKEAECSHRKHPIPENQDV